MLLRDAAGHGVDLRVTGYQFPDAEDPRKLYSWHMVEGHAWVAEGDWQFRYPALTCDETPAVGRWLRQSARQEPDRPLSFTEPNLGFTVLDRDATTVNLSIELDIEFLPPCRKPKQGPICAGDPWVIVLRLPSNVLLTAAEDWESETAPYPDGLVEGVE